MSTAPIAPQPAGSDEIDLAQLGAALKRHSKLIAKVTGGTLLLTLITTLQQNRFGKVSFKSCWPVMKEAVANSPN